MNYDVVRLDGGGRDVSFTIQDSSGEDIVNIPDAITALAFSELLHTRYSVTSKRLNRCWKFKHFMKIAKEIVREQDERHALPYRVQLGADIISSVSRETGFVWLPEKLRAIETYEQELKERFAWLKGDLESAVPRNHQSLCTAFVKEVLKNWREFPDDLNIGDATAIYALLLSRVKRDKESLQSSTAVFGFSLEQVQDLVDTTIRHMQAAREGVQQARARTLRDARRRDRAMQRAALAAAIKVTSGSQGSGGNASAAAGYVPARPRRPL